MFGKPVTSHERFCSEALKNMAPSYTEPSPIARCINSHENKNILDAVENLETAQNFAKKKLLFVGTLLACFDSTMN